MELVGSGIDRVRAFLLAAGIAADGCSVNEPSAVLVRWRSAHKDKLHCVYVNGELAQVTTDYSQRAVIIAAPYCTQSAAIIEVFAVEPGEAGSGTEDRLDVSARHGRAKIAFARLMSLPYQGRAQVYGNVGDGAAVNYSAPISNEPIRLWACRQDKGGFGLAWFGKGDFGYDGCSAVGFGKGAFGAGEFGFDSDLVEWTSGQMQTGRYKFGIRFVDRYGDTVGADCQSGELVLIKAARPAEGLKIDSELSAEGVLGLKVSYPSG